MKFKANRDQLVVKVNKLIKNVPAKSALPITLTFLFEIQGGMMFMHSNNTSIQMSTAMEVSSDGEGAFCVPAGILCGTLNALRDDDVNFQFKDNKLIIKSGKEKYQIATIPAADFIKFPVSEKNNHLVMNSNDLKYALDCVESIVVEDPVKVGLSGISITADGTNVKVIGASGQLVGMITFKFITGTQWENTLMPVKLSSLIRKVLGENEEVHLYSNAKGIEIASAGTSIISTLIDAKYPIDTINKFFEKRPDHFFEMEKTFAEEAVKKVGLFSDDVYQAVVMDIKKDVMVMQAENQDRNHSAKIEFSIKTDHEVRFGFNLEYISQIFSKMNGDNIIQFFFEAHNKPAQVVPMKHSDKIKEEYLLLPIIIQEEKTKDVKSEKAEA